MKAKKGNKRQKPHRVGGDYAVKKTNNKKPYKKERKKRKNIKQSQTQKQQTVKNIEKSIKFNKKAHKKTQFEPTKRKENAIKINAFLVFCCCVFPFKIGNKSGKTGQTNTGTDVKIIEKSI